MPAKKFICLLPKHADVHFDTSLTSAFAASWRTHHATCVPAMRMTAPNPEKPSKSHQLAAFGTAFGADSASAAAHEQGVELADRELAPGRAAVVALVRTLGRLHLA